MMAAMIGQLSCIGIVAGTGIGASPIIAPFSFNGVADRENFPGNALF
jgi:hypothetical protein